MLTEFTSDTNNKTKGNLSVLDETELQLSRFIPDNPESLYQPLRDMIKTGGKRVRPVLTVLASRLGGEEDPIVKSHAIAAGCAVELLHSFTLIHDDIMDNASTRRGQPTMHVTHGMNTAILSGDVTIALAMGALSSTHSERLPDMIQEFSLGFRAVCEGQALDKEFETRNDIRASEYLRMIDLKTAKVLELAAVLGSIAQGGAYQEELRAYAHHLGIAFQIKDDLLDLTAEHAQFGKMIGGDVLEGKRTYLFVTAMERYSDLPAMDCALLDRIAGRTANAADIPQSRNLFDRIGVLQATSERAKAETVLAESALAAIPDTHPKRELLAFASELLGRER